LLSHSYLLCCFHDVRYAMMILYILKKVIFH
jgi:hypothetical protein